MVEKYIKPDVSFAKVTNNMARAIHSINNTNTNLHSIDDKIVIVNSNETQKNQLATRA